MRQINIYEAKTQLFKLIADGQEVVIVQCGEPVARLVPIRPPAARRVPGSALGKFRVPPEFFEPLPDDMLEFF
jgi:prevent-host-death family protein